MSNTVDYIKDTFNGYSFGYGYKQVFLNRWGTNLNNEIIIKFKNDNVISDEDLEIVKFLYEFNFATPNIIATYLDNGDTVEVIKNKLDKLVKHRLLNKFMLAKGFEEKMLPDALAIYCLDLGGKTLLTHYYKPNSGVENWYTYNIMMSSEMITHCLVTADFYVQLKRSCGSNLVTFKSLPNYRIAKNVVIPSFEICVMYQGVRKYFIGQIAREEDFPIDFRNQIQRIDSIVSTKAWMKYFYDTDTVPPLLIVAENDTIAQEACKAILTCTDIKENAFRLTTDERMQKPLSSPGAILKCNIAYDEEGNKEEKIVGVKFPIFSKPE